MILSIYIITGITLLYFGADWLVKGSSNLAIRAGVPSLIVGLTIVALGTSAPELVVSVRAGLDGLGNISVGNVVGSNIFNIAIILGLSALIRPMKVNIQVLRIDTPLMVIISLLLWYLIFDKHLDRYEGFTLLIGIAGYLFLTIYFAKKKHHYFLKAGDKIDVVKTKSPLIPQIILIIVGVMALIFGARLFVLGAIDIAKIFNISEAIIGLTIVSMGTSLPELATSIVAAFKGEEDIAIGNIIGSNIFNILAILGVTGALTPLYSANIGNIDLGYMFFLSVAVLPIMWTGLRINRIEGGFLLMTYLGYLIYLWP